MLRKIALSLSLMITMPTAAMENREVASEVSQPSVELAAAAHDIRSFFEPKTESDVFELATIGQDFEQSLALDSAN